MATARKRARPSKPAGKPAPKHESRPEPIHLNVPISQASVNTLNRLDEEIARLTNEYNLVVSTLLTECADLKEHEGKNVAFEGVSDNPPALKLLLEG